MLHEAQFDLGKWTSKKDFVLEGFRQRLATYEKHGGRSAHEPAVVEAWRKHQDHFKQEEDKFEKELTKIQERIKDSADNYARLLVKSLPTDETKERHLVDSVMAKLANGLNSATSPSENRIQKLEKQMASLLESQKTHEANCAKLTEENEKQRQRITLYEAQAADLAVLKAQQEQLQQQLQKQLSDKTSRDEEIQTLKKDKEALMSQVSACQTQLADLTKRIDSQQINTSKLDSSEQVTAMEKQVKALDSQIKEHDQVFSNIDGEEYAELVTKVMRYPDYPELKRILDGQEDEMKRLAQQANNSLKRHAATESRIGLDFKKFSDQVIETCGKQVQDLEKRIENLHAQPEVPAEELQRLRDDYNRIENALDLLRNEIRQLNNAHETMITALDEQFKNVTTLDLANVILEHLKRLPATSVSLDFQNLHERLVDLEMFRQEYIRRSKHFAEEWSEDLQKVIANKRSLAEDDDGVEQQEKRQRVETLTV